MWSVNIFGFTNFLSVKSLLSNKKKESNLKEEDKEIEYQNLNFKIPAF